LRLRDVAPQKPFGTGYRAVPAIMEAPVPPLPRIITAKAQFRPTGEELYELVEACLQKNAADRLSADELVSRCERLCYLNAPREFGRIKRFDNRYWGFISADEGRDVFFHIESVFGQQQRLSVGDRVWFARHTGGGSDRAFPVVKAT
jgi:eukaryotic-like serine/threonine-protein kinase